MWPVAVRDYTGKPLTGKDDSFVFTGMFPGFRFRARSVRGSSNGRRPAGSSQASEEHLLLKHFIAIIKR
jgi:hypothetical protein